MLRRDNVDPFESMDIPKPFRVLLKTLKRTVDSMPFSEEEASRKMGELAFGNPDFLAVSDGSRVADFRNQWRDGQLERLRTEASERLQKDSRDLVGLLLKMDCARGDGDFATWLEVAPQALEVALKGATPSVTAILPVMAVDFAVQGKIIAISFSKAKELGLEFPPTDKPQRLPSLSNLAYLKACEADGLF